MYNLLVVDDEEIAIRGIVNGIDWSTLPIASIYTAIDAEEAQALLTAHTIHIMISDIDMPNQSGIELLEWANEHSPSSVTIFLTVMRILNMRSRRFSLTASIICSSRLIITL